MHETAIIALLFFTYLFPNLKMFIFLQQINLFPVIRVTGIYFFRVYIKIKREQM